MESNDPSHNGDSNDRPQGMNVDGRPEVGVHPSAPPSLSQEIVAATPSPEDKFLFEIPLGYIFAPSDQELILYYLKPKLMGDPTPLCDFFTDVDLYSLDPRTLIENRKGGGKDGKEWYFFTQRDRKYPNGSRPNRCTPTGVWKASGKDSLILMENTTIGYKRLLAFSRGISKGQGDGTVLNMYEYRLKEDVKRIHSSADRKNGMKDKRLDEWVLCKIYIPKHAKHPKKGLNSDRPTSRMDKQNVDQPNGINNNPPMTADKIQGRKKVISNGYLQDLRFTTNHELDTSQHVDMVDNYQFPQSSQISFFQQFGNYQPGL